VQRQLPGSARRYTQAQIDDRFNPPDWYPASHPPLPRVVASGRRPDVFACTLCHLTNGSGHPESAGVAGLPVNYILRQLAEMKRGTRKGARAATMASTAAAMTDAEMREAAAYFSALPAIASATVVEAAVVPKSQVGKGAMRFALPGGGSEPIGDRIIEIPVEAEVAESRGPQTHFTAYVPPGSLARGEALVRRGGGGKTVACATCHGPALEGRGEAPSILGQSPLYVFRQLNDIKRGTRRGAMAALMQPIVARLDAGDMLAISAYLAAREP